MPEDRIAYSEPVGDRVAYTTCYMCACRCGIKVHLKNGALRYIEGNRDHPVNRGVLCGKGSAGIMTALSPARLRKPLKRIGPRGAGEFIEIEWDEAMAIATERLAKIRATAPNRLAFFTGRDQSQSLTGYFAQMFGTMNFAAHGGFCSVNMAAAGIYSLGGAFWEFGEPDWEHAKLFLLFGVAEDHDSNPIKLGLSKLKERGAKFVSINPVRTGYSAIADEFIGITPGTDGLFVLALIHCLLESGSIDTEFLIRYTNAHYLVIDAPGEPGNGLFIRNEFDKPLAYDRTTRAFVDAQATGTDPALLGSFSLPDGRQARPAFALLAERYSAPDYAPEAAAQRCGVDAATIRRIAAEIAEIAFNHALTLDQPWIDSAGRRHATMIGRPVAMHAMRGISAHSNGFHTCRAIHVLQMLIGAVDTPGSWRYKSPYPKPIPAGPAPGGVRRHADGSLANAPLGFPRGPDDLLVDDAGEALRLDRAFSWDAPLGIHGLMHMAIAEAHEAGPDKIDTLFMYMSNMAWNSAMNPGETTRMLTDRDAGGNYRIPFVIYADAFFSETVAYADLVLPDTTYLERYDCISLLDRPIGSAHGPADAIRVPVLKPDRDVRPFQDVLIDLAGRLGLPNFVDESGNKLYASYADYMVRHERKPGIGPLAGFRGEDGTAIGRGAPNPDQLRRYVENHGFWRHHLPPEQLYYKHANRAYLEGAKAMGLVESDDQIVLHLYSEIMQRFCLAGEGHGSRLPPERLRARIARVMDPLPIWYPPVEETLTDTKRFPLHAITQRPMAMYHSWGSQNAWLRQILSENRLYLHRDLAAAHDLADEDWVFVESRNGRVKCQVRLMDGVNPGTVWTWNAIGKRSGAWALAKDAPEARRGFLLNHIISEYLPADAGGARQSNSDPVTGQAAWFDLTVRLEKCEADTIAETQPRMAPLDPPFAVNNPAILRFGAKEGVR
ncbi:molybdopterin oxidoreductase family protein [Acidiphilium sp. AL]|uniref:Molybdopterin oxidoreductase family protein n=1 Tax=Acidiphilium iwatense TaxID=768198 RepID=A0ABS9DQT5_9PROT|nr:MULTISPECIES: molybdopterin oxidoreductase family protein [Acidiphilium]MCF3945109.1 molybdopterin oxidoreductase family protein [Acidiphilium iwatense]MCU4160546.1 molybdopterin oxidoreductase family protein [Acidiphilium sp. AL]